MKKLGFIAVLLLIFSCLNDKNTPLPPATVVVPAVPSVPEVPSTPVVNCSPDTIYFQQSVLPLITSNCAMSGCHDAISHVEGVILTDHANIMREVKVSSPTSSDLYKCLNETGDERMPPAPSAEFSITQKSLLLKWIQQGAKNNACINTSTSACVTTNMSFATNILPIFATNCNGCHNATVPAGGINLTTYNGTKAISARLLGSIAHTAGYSPMPSSTTKLAACDINKIAAWMSQGTLNN